METVTGQRKEVSVNANKEIVETAQALIALYKREFGEQWAEAFKESVNVEVAAHLP
jgi:hypothetical protein